MLENCHIAILTRVNDLADRFGLKPYEFVAVLDNTRDEYIALRYEVPVSGDAAKERRFSGMLQLLGVGDESNELRGDYIELVEALDKALQLAPKQRHRP